MKAYALYYCIQQVGGGGGTRVSYFYENDIGGRSRVTVTGNRYPCNDDTRVTNNFFYTQWTPEG